MQRMIAAKSIVNNWMAGTSTMIRIKDATLGEGLSKVKKIERSRWGRKPTVCLQDSLKSHQ